MANGLFLCRQAYEQLPPHIDVLLLGPEGSLVYSGPLRLTVPYFLSIGVDIYGSSPSQESLQSIVCSPDASTPFLDGQVRPRQHACSACCYLISA